MKIPLPPSSQSPARQFATEIVSGLRHGGYTAYWAGGCVRDLLLKKVPKDYDVATDARPDEVRRLFKHRITRAVGASFGVILVVGPEGAGDIEVATFRSEGPYLDGRRPSNVAFCTPEEDAQRRDFTINGMFYDPLTEEVLDFIQGVEDLDRRLIRAIGVASERFAEDKLRLLRAIRFAASLDFELEVATADAIRDMAATITVVSAERIAAEWKRMLTHPSRLRALDLAADTDLLWSVFPEAQPLQVGERNRNPHWQQAMRAVSFLQRHDFELVLATWLADVPGYDVTAARQLGLRLRLSNHETDRLVWLRAHADALCGAPTFSAARLKRLLAHPDALLLIDSCRARLLAAHQSTADAEFCAHYLQATPPDVLNPSPVITGDDLIRHGFRPGKRFRPLLEALRDAQLNGEIASLEDGLALAATLEPQR